jgi:hypothetical protein
VAATQQATDAIDAAQAALDTAEALHPLAPGALQVVNPRPSGGPALLSFEVLVPSADFTEPERVQIWDGDTPLPRRVTSLGVDGLDARLAVELVLEVAPQSLASLSWTYGPDPSEVEGGLSEEDAPDRGPVTVPFVDCDGIRTEGVVTDEDPGRVDSAGFSAWRVESFELPTCDDMGTLSRTYTTFAGLPGTVVDVQAVIGSPEEPLGLQSVVLTPVACEGGAVELTWQTFGGAIQTRPARDPVEAWNGQSADGWIQTTCVSGSHWQIAHDTTLRTSLAFAPLHNEGGTAFVAPLGTLYGSAPWHQPRRTGGHGFGDLLVPAIADTFQPAAPDWAGAEIAYRLLVTEDTSPETLDLFAHPPWVRVGR